jgi:hypothetical protein
VMRMAAMGPIFGEFHEQGATLRRPRGMKTRQTLPLSYYSGPETDPSLQHPPSKTNPHFACGILNLRLAGEMS